MKRFRTISFLTLALFVSATALIPTAHAQFDGSPNMDAALNQNAPTAADQAAANMPGISTIPPAAANTPVTPPANPDVSSGFGGVMIWIMGLFAWLVGVAAITLNYAVYYTVVTMGNYVHNLSAVGVTWRILRDIANIMLIFGFLGAGIATILNVDQYGWKTKMLPMLLVAAVFLNFSLFITEAMIDGTNLFATQFYTQINGGTLPTPADISRTGVAGEGISNKIMGQLGLQTIYTAARTNQDAYKNSNTWIIGFMGIILFLITAFVMFSLAFILIARFVALIFFIILCPVGFMGLAIPQMKYRAGQWWTNFLEQIITAPVLILLLYVALAVITDAQFLTGICGGGTCTKNWLGFVSGNDLGGFAGMMLSFLIAMGLLLVVVVKAKSMSAFGAGMATKAASRLSGATIMAAGTANSTRWVGRNTLGRAGNTRIGKALGMGSLATASFDFRNSKLAKTAQTRAGLDLGKGEKGSYKTYAAEQQKSANKKKTEAELKQAEKAEAEAAKAHRQLQAQHDTAAAEYAKQNAEVERLKREQEENMRRSGFPDPQTEEKLEAAEAAAAPSKKAFEAAKKAMTDTEDSLRRTKESAQRTREKIEKMKDREALDEVYKIAKELKDKPEKEVAEKKEAKPE